MTLDCRKLLHLIFPPSDNEKILLDTDLETFLEYSHERFAAHIRYLLPYEEPAVRAAIHLNKYHYHKTAQRYLAAALNQQIQKIAKERSVLIPVPLSRKRLRSRGYNQVEEITRACPHVAVHTNILQRVRDTTPQTKLSKKERMTNVVDAFMVRDRYAHILAGCHIIVVDDVTTTGATLRAAHDALLQNGPASITLLALAH